MTLVLAIKCITPSLTSKPYTFKIFNQSLSIPIHIENNFIHNYQYVYRLWPCRPGQMHTVTIELIQKIGELQRQRGKVEGKIVGSYEGDLYKMYGVLENDEMILMKFIIEDEESGQEGREQAQLKRINKQMEQNLIKYRKEIQNYQEFLYFTNHVIKELNDETGLERRDLKNDGMAKDFDEENEDSYSQSRKTQRSLRRNEEKRMIPPQQQLKQSFRKNFPKQIIETQRLSPSQKEQEHTSTPQGIKVSQAKTVLNKYPYLEQEYHQNERPNGKNTPINRLRDEDDDLILSTQPNRSNEITVLIKKRRQQYLLPKETHQKERFSLSKNSKATNKIYQNKKFHISSLQVNMQKSIPIPQVNNHPQGKSTRSQTGLKQMVSHDKSTFEDKITQNIANPPLTHKQYNQQAPNTSKKPQSINESIYSVRKGIFEKQQSKRSHSEREKTIRESVNKISRRKKFIAQKDSDSSARYTTQEMKPLISNESGVSANENVVNKLTVFNIHTLFYTNFKNSVKKCIIEHNHQIYETQLQQNNLKETSWTNDRVVISPISPFQEIIFQIYSLKNERMELQGSSVIKISQIVGNKNKTLKFYLYFEDIAVGSIKFDVQKQVKSHKRLTVSLPEIKQKSNIHEYEAKNSKTVKIPKKNEYSTQISSPQNMQMQQSMRKIIDSKEQQSQNLNYDDLTTKIRNLKLQRKNRLK